MPRPDESTLIVSAERAERLDPASASPSPATPNRVVGVERAPATEPPLPINVLVIDDELAGLTAAHLRGTAGAFVAELGDINSPTTAAVWAIVSARTGRPPFEAADADEVAKYFASDDFVREVVLHDDLRNAALPDPELLRAFYEHEAGVRELRSLLETAYAAPRFKLRFEPARPLAPSALVAYDLVVLDLVLAGSARAVDELVEYLKTLASNAAKLPCLIVLSSREEMVDNRPRFSTEASISAAGLLLLEKRHVRHAQFGATGLLLSYEQLSRQRDVAQNIRQFISAWMAGLEGAKAKAAETLWNLDAAAMQEIHLTAGGDDDPYDAHLNELVSREYLWHVEGVAAVAAAVSALDESFQKHLKTENGKNSIGNRFVAPYADAKPGRSLVSHYNWTGFTPTGSLNAHTPEELALKFNHLLPFGAVLAPETLANGAECWVHITQQCDLNAAVRAGKSGEEVKISAMFAVAIAEPVSDRRLPSWKGADIVAKGLRFGTQEFDLKLVNGRLLSMPIKPLIALALQERRQVVGRLRHDIATQFLNSTSNHMTRAAQLKATRMEIKPARLYVWGIAFKGGGPVPLLMADGRTPCEVQVSTTNNAYYIADHASLWVALWLTELARVQLSKTDLMPTKVYDTLRGGIRNGGNVVSVINLKVVAHNFNQIDTLWRGQAPKDPMLYLVHEPDPTH
jgi:hypothetical protein